MELTRKEFMLSAAALSVGCRLHDVRRRFRI